MTQNNDSPQAPMTRPQQPHPLRCETCNQLLDDPNNRYCFCKKFSIWIDGEDLGFVKTIGCASHSSAPARERPKYPQTCDMSKWTPEEIANRLQCAYDKGVREAQQPPAPSDALLDELETWCDEDKPLTDVMITRSNTWWYRRFKGQIAALRQRGRS